MAARISGWRLGVLIAAAAAVILIATHAIWLRSLAHFLIRSDAPFKADAVVVLAGDFTGSRIVTAAELVKSGYAHDVIVSGPSGAYGHYECDLAIAFIVKKGYPPEWFHCFRNNARSTRAEAQAVMAELRRLNAHRFLLVTSNFHTRRAGGVFEHEAKDLEFRVIAAPFVNFNPDDWWRDREAQKTFLVEWMKTVADWLGI